MVTSPLPPRRTPAALQDAIVDIILDRGLGVGDAVPTEAEFQGTLGVSRNSIREALKMLHAVGVVEIRHGYGTFVTTEPLGALHRTLRFRAQLSLSGNGEAAMELIDVREALECGLIGNVIGVLDEATLGELEDLVRQMEAAAPDGRPFKDVDQEFHRALFAPLQNAILTELLEVFWEVYTDIHETVAPASGWAEDFEDTALNHRNVLDAVRARDTTAAVARMHEHFVGIRRLIDHEVQSGAAAAAQPTAARWT